MGTVSGLFFCREGEETDKKLLGGLVRFRRTPVLWRLYLLGIPLISLKSRRKTVARILGIPLWFHDRTQSFFNYLGEMVEPGHDHIYIIRHNIGETFVYLSYIKQWIEVNKSQKPLVIAWRKKNISFYKMFLGEDIPVQYLSIPQSDINSFLREEVKDWNGKKSFARHFELPKR